MNLRDLPNAFPPMPETCRDALMTAAGSVKEEHNMKRAFRFAVVLAALMLALTSAAYAVSRPQVLDWLLGRDAAAPLWLEEAAQTVDGSASADGVNVSVTSLVCDGEQLVLSFEASVDDPTRAVLVALDDTVSLNGQPALLDVSPMIDHHLVPSPHLDVLPARRNPILAGAWCKKLPELSGTVEAEVTFLIYQPERAFAIVDDDDVLTGDLSDLDEETRAECQDCRDTVNAMANAVIVEGDPDPWQAEGYTLIDRSGRLMAEDEDAHLTEARLTVRFSFNADMPVVFDFSGLDADPLPDAAARIDTFRLSPLSSRVRVALLPSENTEDAVRQLEAAYGEAALTDETGCAVAYADMDWLSTGTPFILQSDGQWLLCYDIDMPGLQTLPESIGLTVQTGDLLRFPLR